jgi:2-oxoisovalerate dehydrogenase E1 component
MSTDTAARVPSPATADPPATAAPTAGFEPGIRDVVLTPEGLAAISRRRLAMALLILQTIRRFERWLLDNAGLVHGPLHSSIGQEAVAAGAALALGPTDAFTSTHRAHHDVLAKLIIASAPADFDPLTAGEAPASVVDVVQRTLAEIMGLEQGLCRGRGGSMHLFHREAGVMTSAIVGGGIPAAGGWALAARLRGDGRVAVASFGDGATQIGAFHETAALARAWHLPLILLLENNQYSVATTLTETAGFTRLALRARGYDMPALVVDGMDPAAVLTAMTEARAHAVSSGPILVEAITYRYFHQNGPLPGSAFRYRTRDEEREWQARDPLTTFPDRLVAAGLLEQRQVDHVMDMGAALVACCVAAVTTETPDGPVVPAHLYPPTEDTRRGMLGPGLPELPSERLDETPAPDVGAITYTAAISGVIARNLERDPEAFVMGEEVGHLGGGVMGLTKDALAVAPERVLSTPICENGFTGAALGAALAGMHPIVEFMYPDFVLEATDQLFNHVAKSRYMFGGHHEVPVVVRTQVSRGRGYGPQHSCDPAGLFATFPGWRVASPSTPADYVGCFNAAMLCRDPVLVIDDHRLARTTGTLPAAGFDHVTPIGRARRVRAGRDVTVLAWGYATLLVADVAERLAAAGIEVEILDPRWLDRASFDRVTVLASVARTGALVVIEDALRSFSAGGHVIDYLSPELFGLLRGAPLRVTGQDVHAPVSKPLEAAVQLQAADIEAAVVEAARGSRDAVR